MKAKLLKIQELTMSRNQDVVYSRLHFELEDGSFAMTDVVPTYRNYIWWKPVIQSGTGTWVDNIILINPHKIDADSRVIIIHTPKQQSLL